MISSLLSLHSQENDLDIIVPSLFKRAGEPSGFLGVEAEKTLGQMILTVSENKSLPALLACAAHKNAAVRGKVALFLCKLVDNYGARVTRCKDYDRLFQVIFVLSSFSLLSACSSR